MTSLEQVFMLERSLRLTFQTMLAIYKSGAGSHHASPQCPSDASS